VLSAAGGRTGVLIDERHRANVPVAVRVNGRLEDDSAADDLNDHERMRVAVYNTDDVVQLSCEHPFTDLQPKSWGTHPVPVWGWEPRAAER
jgi:hypothetical protein